MLSTLGYVLKPRKILYDAFHLVLHNQKLATTLGAQAVNLKDIQKILILKYFTIFHYILIKSIKIF